MAALASFAQAGVRDSQPQKAAGVKLDLAGVASQVVLLSKERWLRNKRRSHRLWTIAKSQVSPTLRTYLDFRDDELKDPPKRVLNLVEESYQRDKVKRWRIKRISGEEVFLCDVLAKIAGWVKRFKEVGASIMQYDPGHAALPWAGICFCLDIIMSNAENYIAYVEGMERVSRIIAEYAEYQKDLLRGTSSLKHQLEIAVISLYTAVLTYLAETKRYLESSTGKRLARNLGHAGQPKALELLDAIEKRQLPASRLVDAVRNENSMRKLSDMQRTLQGLENALVNPGTSVAEMRSVLMKRFAAVFTNDVLDAALSKRQKGTSNWIFERFVYQQWAEFPATSSKLLWIHGPPGFGKTILSASAIERLKSERRRTVAYFFCVYEDEAKRDPGAIIGSCIAQMVEQNDLAAHVAYRTVGGHVQRPLTVSELWSCFRQVCNNVPNCTLVIDGFDECSNQGPTSRPSDDDAKPAFLCKLIEEVAATQAYVLLVSRDDADIRSEVLDKSFDNIDISHYTIEKVDSKQDVEAVTQSLINDKLKDRPQNVRDEIAKNAADKSDGMILWVQLLSKQFRPRANAKALARIVSEMPPGIEQAYERDLIHLSQLEGDDRVQAVHILRWILFAPRPMTVKEVVEALALRDVQDGDDYPADELPDSWDEQLVSEDYANDLFRRTFGSLIVLRSSYENQPPSMHTLHFVHYSVKEFLLKPTKSGISHAELICFPNPLKENTTLASLCLRYLCFDIFDKPPDDTATDNQILSLQKYPFLSYAAQNWYWHASRRSPVSTDLVPLVQDLLNPSSTNWLIWAMIFEAANEISANLFRPKTGTTKGLTNTETIADANRRFSQPDFSTNLLSMNCFEEENFAKIRDGVKPHDSRPLYYASILGFVDVVKDLQASGCSLNGCVGTLGTPLHAAVYRRHKPLVEYLLEQNMNVQKKAGPFGYAIVAAALVGGIEIFQLLVNHHANLNSANNLGNTPAHYAAIASHNEIIRILIDHGADIDKANMDGVTPLHCAVVGGNLGTVKMLLDARANINAFRDAKKFACCTPLDIAILNDHERIFETLLDRGADVFNQDGKRFTSLHLAVYSRSKKIFNRILSTNCNLDVPGVNDRTALQYAIWNEEDAMAISLIEKGANVKWVDKFGWMALHCACTKSGTLQLFRKLIDHGSDVNIASGQSHFMPVFPLQNVVSRDDPATPDIIQLLLERGADALDTPRAGVRSALDIVLLRNEYAKIRQIMQHKPVQSKLLNFSGKDNVEVSELVDVLLKKDADIFRTAINAGPKPLTQIILSQLLVVAVISNQEAAVQLLLNKGASLAYKTVNNRTALHYAALAFNDNMVRTLVSRGASVVEMDDDSCLPMDLVASHGAKSAALVEFLIQRQIETKSDTEEVCSPALMQFWRDNVRFLHGEYTYYLRGQTGTDTGEFSIDIPPWSASGGDEPLHRPPRFVAEGEDGPGKFKVYGLLHGENRIKWQKQYEKHAWMWHGEIDFAKKKIAGFWGRNEKGSHGNFSLFIESKSAEELESSPIPEDDE